MLRKYSSISYTADKDSIRNLAPWGSAGDVKLFLVRKLVCAHDQIRKKVSVKVDRCVYHPRRRKASILDVSCVLLFELYISRQ
jgi:hypothetical protein